MTDAEGGRYIPANNPYTKTAMTIVTVLGSGYESHKCSPLKMGKQCQTLFFWAPKSLQMVTAAMKLKDA